MPQSNLPGSSRVTIVCSVAALVQEAEHSACHTAKACTHLLSADESQNH